MSTIRTLSILLGSVCAIGGYCRSAAALDAAPPQAITNSIGMKLVLVPAGTFMMGAEEDRIETLNFFPYCDPTWLDGELPRHRVRITKPFYMGQYEVTLAQFLTFYHSADYRTDIERDGRPSLGYVNNRLVESSNWRPWAPGWQIGMDHPAVYISWNDATAFCRWLSAKEGKTYRLPTEAEWEYACRAGTSSRYFFGNNPEDLVRYANVADVDRRLESEKDGSKSIITFFDGNGNRIEKNIPFPFLMRRDGYAWTTPVGKFQPNAFGLYDTHGNAWEWCADRYEEDYYASSPADDPQGPSTGASRGAPPRLIAAGAELQSTGASRVARGGGFDDTPVNVRCAYRASVGPSDRSYDSGFRIVCEP